jgi:hypothetical protein
MFLTSLGENRFFNNLPGLSKYKGGGAMVITPSPFFCALLYYLYYK